MQRISVYVCVCVCVSGVNRRAEQAPKRKTFWGRKVCNCGRYSPIYSKRVRADLTVGTVVTKETVNKDCVHRPKS